MTPAEQIQIQTAELEGQITDLIVEFEKRTGVVAERIGLAEFARGSVRSHGDPLNVWLSVGLPPCLEKSKQV